MKQQVSKMFSPEEKTILANIKSLVSQLESMEAAETDSTPVSNDPDRSAVAVSADVKNVQKTAKEKSMDLQSIKQKMMAGEDLAPEEKLMVIESLPKGDAVTAAMPVEDEDVLTNPDDELELSKKKGEGETGTASADAEDRDAAGNEETTEDAVGEVGDNMKAIAASIAGEINKSLKGIKDQINANSDAVAGLLDGIGLTKVLEKEEKKPVQKARPVVSLDAEQVLALVKGGQVEKSEDADGIGMVESFDVRKSTAGVADRSELGNAMGAMFGVNNQQSGRY